MKVLLGSPRLENLWAIHFSELGGQEYTVPGLFIANVFDAPLTVMPVAPMVVAARGAAVPPAPAHDGMAYWIKVSARSDGSFTMTNGRNGFNKSYGPKS